MTSELEFDKLSFADNFNLVSGQRWTPSVLADDAQPLLGSVHDLNFVKWPSVWKFIRNNVLKRAEFNQAKTIIYIHFDELIISLILF